MARPAPGAPILRQEAVHEAKNVKAIIPVVASPYQIDEDIIVAPTGIEELVAKTLELLPEGETASLRDAADFIIGRKRALSHSTVFASTIAAAAAGATPMAGVDVVALAPIQTAEVKAICTIFGIEKNDEARRFIDSIVEVGTTAMVGKALISGLKAIPGINLPAAVINAIVSGAIVAAIGEGSIVAFEKIYRGEENLSDLDWIKEFMESILGDKLTEETISVANNLDSNSSAKEVASAVFSGVSRGQTT